VSVRVLTDAEAVAQALHQLGDNLSRLADAVEGVGMDASTPVGLALVSPARSSCAFDFSQFLILSAWVMAVRWIRDAVLLKQNRRKSQIPGARLFGLCARARREIDVWQ
jgi:hypothetical protein